MRLLLYCLTIMVCMSLRAEPIQLTNVEINYEPVISINYLPLNGSDIVDTYTELIFQFQPNKETKQGYWSGSIEITLIIYGNVDLIKLVNSSQLTIAKQIIDQQAIDAKILLENKFGGYLSRLNSSSFDSPQLLMEQVLDTWNTYWRKSSAIWNPFYAGLKTGVYPSQSTNYLRHYRFLHFGDSNV